MIILHAGFQGKHLLLWGETAQPPAESESKPRRATKRVITAKPARLIYDAGTEGLLSAMAEFLGGVQIAKSDFEDINVWLPTIDGWPMASNALIAEPVESKSKPVLAPWMVTALPLATVEAIEVLSLCVDKTMLSPGVVIGGDLAYWATAMRFAGAITAREQFLPAVINEGGKYHARWLPVFAGNDTERLQKLARAMPHVCRATTAADAAAPPDTAAVSVLSKFVGAIVDYLARVDREKPASTKRSFDTLHDQWLSSLRTMQSELQGKAPELEQLAAQSRDWRRPIEITASSAFRLCFRLEEPEESKEELDSSSRRPVAPSKNGWYVRYLLQAADDPSLMVPVADAWNARGKSAAVLNRKNFNAREYLLSALGQATSASPHIEQSLKSAAPAGYGLDAAGAFDFLQEKAWMLEQSGFNVLLPAWWTRKGTKLRLTARANVKSPKFQGGGGLSLSDIVQFNYEVALGDEVLSLKELEALAKLKAPLVRIRGQWVQLSAEEIQTAIEFWKKKATGKATVRELVQMSLGAGKAVKGIAFDGVSADGWIGDLLARLDGRKPFRELEPMEKFNGMLRPYQMRGYSWLGFLREIGFGACLADDMGLGKTVQTLALIQRDWQTADAKNRRPVLLVCPMSVMGNWQKEAARFTPDLPVMIHHGLTRTKGAAFKKEAAKHAIVISSYALLHRDLAVLEGVNWQGVILDEAQNIKNAETKQSKAARSIKSDYRIALTGTPVENNVGDLWSIMEFLNPGFLGNQAEFKRNFFLPIQTQGDQQATAQLKRLTTPFILRRLKTDKTIINDLPDKMEMKVFCNLTKEQASLYAAVAADVGKSLEEAEGIQRRGLVLATLMKLKQVCNHPAQFLGDNSAIPGRSGKLARLTEMLEEVLSAGERALVFTQFTEMGEIIQRHLQESFGHEVLFLHGGVTKKNRDRMVERFQSGAPGSPPIFLLSLKAGGTGLNLTAANHVFHFDRWWNPAVENQATDRAFRIGQKRNVQVHKFLCAGTLEEKIDEMIERKSEIASSIVGTGEGWLTELSTKELKDLFALRADAVGE
jgi:SNF2 family DNA or RNA helicase